MNPHTLYPVKQEKDKAKQDEPSGVADSARVSETEGRNEEVGRLAKIKLREVGQNKKAQSYLIGRYLANAPSLILVDWPCYVKKPRIVSMNPMMAVKSWMNRIHRFMVIGMPSCP